MKATIITYNAIFAVCIFLCTIESDLSVVAITTAYTALSIYLFARNKKACYRVLRKGNIAIEKLLRSINL